MAAVVVINITPTAVLDGDSPHERWFRNIPGASHLRVFGCVAYRHVPKDLRKKTDGKAIECIFVGYNANQGDYKLLRLHDLEVIRAKDVVFIENKPARIPSHLLRQFTGEQTRCGCNQCAVAEERPALTQDEIDLVTRMESIEADSVEGEAENQHSAGRFEESARKVPGTAASQREHRETPIQNSDRTSESQTGTSDSKTRYRQSDDDQLGHDASKQAPRKRCVDELDMRNAHDPSRVSNGQLRAGAAKKQAIGQKLLQAARPILKKNSYEPMEELARPV
jgi:hypothetical protein